MVTPISGIGAAVPAAPLAAPATPAVSRTAGGDFAKLVQDGLEGVSALEHDANAAVQDLATGGTTRIEDVMVATSQAQLGIELLARVRDRALEAYQEVMRLPV